VDLRGGGYMPQLGPQRDPPPYGTESTMPLDMNALEDGPSNESTSPLSDWLAAFKTACLNLDLENERQKKIPALALTVKERTNHR
jgi:hypothetical protein